MLNPKIIGAVSGLVLGLIVIIFGVMETILVILFVLAGWFIAKVWMGEIDLQELYERFMKSRGKRPRG